MKKQLSEKFFAELGFSPLVGRFNQDQFPIYVRHYDALATSLFFDHLLGEFYRIQFPPGDWQERFKSGDLAVFFEGDTRSIKSHTFSYKAEKIDLLKSQNLQMVISSTQFLRAFLSFEATITRLVEHGFEEGDRILYSTEGLEAVGRIASIKPGEVVIEYGDRRQILTSFSKLTNLTRFKKSNLLCVSL